MWNVINNFELRLDKVFRDTSKIYAYYSLTLSGNNITDWNKLCRILRKTSKFTLLSLSTLFDRWFTKASVRKTPFVNIKKNSESLLRGEHQNIDMTIV